MDTQANSDPPTSLAPGTSCAKDRHAADFTCGWAITVRRQEWYFQKINQKKKVIKSNKIKFAEQSDLTGHITCNNVCVSKRVTVITGRHHDHLDKKRGSEQFKLIPHIHQHGYSRNARSDQMHEETRWVFGSLSPQGAEVLGAQPVPHQCAMRSCFWLSLLPPLFLLLGHREERE